MFKATNAAQLTERSTVAPPRWRWYHAAIFYAVVPDADLWLVRVGEPRQRE